MPSNSLVEPPPQGIKLGWKLLFDAVLILSVLFTIGNKDIVELFLKEGVLCQIVGPCKVLVLPRVVVHGCGCQRELGLLFPAALLFDN